MGYTPMMEQYLQIKQNHRDSILFFRLGDFYEMFFDDALIGSKELEITLTGRDAGGKDKIPMCGVPYHAADTYIARLIKKGYKVAICEQVEDPTVAKGIVRREVVKIITPGTVLDDNTLEEKQNNYLVAVFPHQKGFGLAVADVSTGLFQITQFVGEQHQQTMLLDELVRLQPAEVLLPDVTTKPDQENLVKNIQERIQVVITLGEESLFQTDKARRQVKTLAKGRPWDVEWEEAPLGVIAAGALLAYIAATQKQEALIFQDIQIYGTRDFMFLDANTRRNLEITSSLKDGGRWGTLLWVLDNTRTAMGGRLLKNWLERPLLQIEAIEKRLAAVEAFTEDVFARNLLMEKLTAVYDMERLVSKVLFGNANARDLLALKKSFAGLPNIRAILKNGTGQLLQEYYQQLDPLEDICHELEIALNEDPPVSIREGSLIKDGYHKEIDALRTAAKNGQQWLTRLEVEERKRTGIKSLKVGFNKVFGYYIEITKANLSAAPDDYIRRQTLANAERYITPRLKEMEERILGAEEKLVQLEYEVFQVVKEKVAVASARILTTASVLAGLDVLVSFAETAIKENYIRPKMNHSERIRIVEGRHPVVEKVLGPGNFVPNDIDLHEERKLVLLTGPNMAGKSTFMRQIALLVLMAQAGSFIPALSAEIGIVDRIFTRIGAADDLAGGQSTFMVEMKECQVIVANAQKNSLIIMDEVGRGTSTYDGISIARALVEYIIKHIGAKTVFSTHYHELTDLGDMPGVHNFTMLVEEQKGKIYFMRKVVPGKADQSYGIHVAALAGLPEEIIAKAQKNLAELEQGETHQIGISSGDILQKVPMVENPLDREKDAKEQHKIEQMEEMGKALFSLDIMNMTPLDAFQLLVQWKEKYNIMDET